MYSLAGLFLAASETLPMLRIGMMSLPYRVGNASELKIINSKFKISLVVSHRSFVLTFI